MSEYFKFEDKNNDFPFYNGNPPISKIDWAILLTGVLVFIGILFYPYDIDHRIVSVLFCLVVLIPIVYVSRNNLSLFFKKPKRKDIVLILMCVILYYMYGIIVASILIQSGVQTYANAIITFDMDLIFWITTLIQLLGEELFKISLFILTLFAVYHFTHKRKLAIVCGVILSLLVFGLLHYNAYNGALLQIILIISIGGIFYTYAYLKTKNVVVTYIIHIIIDAIPLLAVMALKSSGFDPAQLTNLILMLL